MGRRHQRIRKRLLRDEVLAEDISAKVEGSHLGGLTLSQTKLIPRAGTFMTPTSLVRELLMQFQPTLFFRVLFVFALPGGLVPGSLRLNPGAALDRIIQPNSPEAS